MLNNAAHELCGDGLPRKKQPICMLTIHAPKHRCDKFQNLLSPVLRYFDPTSRCIRISDDETITRIPQECGNDTGSVPRYQDNKNILSTPSLAVMAFLQDHGNKTSEDVQRYFRKYPWRLHHKLELQKKRTPTMKIAQQEFYSLSREYPLWSVCPVLSGFEHLRLCLFVTNFSEMVEFYRMVTDSEMESTKPDFCLFPVTSEEDLQVILCLKRCRQLRPFPLTRAYLSFKVRNIFTLKNLLRGNLTEINENHYLINDPDGNLVMLENMNVLSTHTVEYENDVIPHIADVSCDVTSVKSVCGSHDSGRYSDSDQCSSEPDKSLKKSVHFSETVYEKMWINKSEPVSALRNRKSKERDNSKFDIRTNDSARSNADKSIKDSRRDHSRSCYPGMVIAHARLVDNSTVLPGNKTCELNSAPVMTVTDCTGNVHNCIERVIYPSDISERQSFEGFDSGNNRLTESFNHFDVREEAVERGLLYPGWRSRPQEFDERGPINDNVLLCEELYPEPPSQHNQYCSGRPDDHRLDPFDPRQNFDLDEKSHWTVYPSSELLDSENRNISFATNDNIISHDANESAWRTTEIQCREEIDKKRMVTPVYI